MDRRDVEGQQQIAKNIDSRFMYIKFITNENLKVSV